MLKGGAHLSIWLLMSFFILDISEFACLLFNFGQFFSC